MYFKYEIDRPLPFEQEKSGIRSWARREVVATSASRIRAEDKKDTAHSFVSYCLGFQFEKLKFFKRCLLLNFLNYTSLFRSQRNNTTHELPLGVCVYKAYPFRSPNDVFSYISFRINFSSQTNFSLSLTAGSFYYFT